MVPRLMLICRIRAQGNLDIYLAKHIVYLKEWVKHLFTFFYSQPCYPGVECSLVVRQGNNIKNSWTMNVGYACGLCPDGMVGNGVHCSRTDPCESNPCYPGASCTMVNIPIHSQDSNPEVTTPASMGKFRNKI